MEPDVIPTSERRIDIGMVPGQLFSKIGVSVGDFRGGNALNGDVLDKHMRRHEDEARDMAARSAGVDDRDRRTVAMPDEDGLVDAESIEQLRQGDQRLFVHVSHRAMLR